MKLINQMQQYTSRVCQTKMKKRYCYIILLLFNAAFASCRKDSTDTPEIFYGNWKTSYGDTINFSLNNGTNTILYNNSMNPAMPQRISHEFTYRDNKLGIKDGFNGSDFHFFQSFKWVQPGQSYTIQGVDWFNFVNSSSTVFTFTKIIP